MIDPWLVASGCPSGSPITGPGACKLDLKKAPFRVLAISNRVDLECAGYTGAGDGEARFVFGVLDSSGNPLRAAVIFEYKLPPQRGGAPYTAATWEKDWHALSTMPIGSPPYMTVLQGILDDVTKVGALPGGPNLGTSIGQVRTNEIDFGGAPWKLRETRLIPGSGIPGGDLLLATTTAETPDDSMNMSGPLAEAAAAAAIRRRVIGAARGPAAVLEPHAAITARADRAPSLRLQHLQRLPHAGDHHRVPPRRRPSHRQPVSAVAVPQHVDRDRRRRAAELGAGRDRPGRDRRHLQVQRAVAPVVRGEPHAAGRQELLEPRQRCPLTAHRPDLAIVGRGQVGYPAQHCNR
ncbi:MAG: hypothetical protein E6J90_19585 [Deltaproteobacteria bacterium]|nr:MAG: hypothetical protein E6J90_19585 [Deltaproteobacteria bacterium]